MTPSLSIADQVWFNAPETRRVIAALKQARFVGGCVRNSLLGLSVDDIDIATPLTPAEVSVAVQSQGMKAVDTGVEHGTVTVICQSKPFEVTTLRRDVSTDGRRATVAFTNDWAEDAARRDFTINALYADTDGLVHDYHGGISDLRAGRVRFIGDPAIRIAEDHLRILRLFRIHAWYGKGAFDIDALRACVAAKSNISTLSGERIQKEMLKLFMATDPVAAVQTMIESEIFGVLLPGEVNFGRFAQLCDQDRTIVPSHSADGILRLAAIISTRVQAMIVASQWRFSNEHRKRLNDLLVLVPLVRASMSVDDAKSTIYKLGSKLFSDAVRIARAGSADRDQVAWTNLFNFACQWVAPTFPVNGNDVTRAGVPHGPLVGKVLHVVEEWWINNGFPADDLLIASQLEAAVRQSLDSNDISE